ncbi:hypothetical protein ACF0H5_018725 [Mactra antiquata]
MKCSYCISNRCPSSFVDGCTSYKLDSIVKHEKSAAHLKAVSVEKASDTKFIDWAEVNGVFGNRFPNILSVADLVLTMSPTSSEAERGFSQLKLINTRLRTKLSQSLLNDLLAIKLGAPSIKAFNPAEAINLWNNCGQRSRRPNFMNNKKSEAPHVYVADSDNETSVSMESYEDDTEQNCDSDYESDCEEYQECAIFKRLLSFTEGD